MDQESKKIQRNYKDLLRVEAVDIMPDLYQNDVISTEDMQRVEAKVTTQDKMKELIRLIQTKGSKKAYPVLREALLNEYKWIVEQMDGTVISESESSGEEEREQVKELTHDIVRKVCNDPEILNDWKNFGRSLGLEEGDIAEIDYANQRSVKEAVYQVTVKWRSKFGEKANFKALIQCLRSIEANNLADKLDGKK